MWRFERRKIEAKHIILALLITVSFLVGGLVVSLTRPSNLAAVADEQQTTAAGKSVYSSEIIAEIAEKAGPAVVYVESTYKPKNQTRNPFSNDPFFRDFFGDFFFPFEQPPQPGQSVGSGFLISPDGYAITNYHVVDGADNIKVTVQGHKDPYPAKVAWGDASMDLAILKLENAKDLPVVALGSSSQTRVGEWVVAIGNPYELDHTVTAGVLSAKGRKIQIPDSKGQVRTYPNLMQTDAAINPGNSGGPLLNLQGQVIGINTAVNAQAQGIGFAIPIDSIKDIIQQFLKTGKVSRPYLGIYYQGIDEDLARYLDLPDTEGVVIRSVIAGSAAEKAGLKVGDVIREINHKKISKMEDLEPIVRELKVGEKIEILIIRKGELKTIKLTVGEKPQVSTD